MSTDRIACARLVSTPESGTLTVDGNVNLKEYSRFKHGDGTAAAKYGAALADQFAARLPDDITRVKVTSSAFGAVPPSANALVGPFVDRLRQVTMLGVEQFKVDRLSVTNGDYATMTLEQRRANLGSGSLMVDPRASIAGEYVLSVDDVRVTGTHENVIDECLRSAGAGDVQHLYVIDAWEERDNPAAESVMNASSVRTVHDLIDVATGTGFIPNARFCKRVINLSAADQQTFLAAVPAAVTRWVLRAVEADGLAHYPAYAQAAATFQTNAAERRTQHHLASRATRARARA